MAPLPQNLFHVALHAGGLGVALAIAAAIFVLVLAPLNLQRQQISGTLASNAALIAQRDSLLAELAKIREEYEQRESTVKDVRSRLPETPHEAEFLGQITQLARQSSLRIRRYTPAKPIHEGAVIALEVHLETSTTYEGLCRFLDGMSSLSRLCRVTSLQVQAAESSDEVEMPVNLTLRIYYAPVVTSRSVESLNG